MRHAKSMVKLHGSVMSKQHISGSLGALPPLTEPRGRRARDHQRGPSREREAEMFQRERARSLRQGMPTSAVELPKEAKTGPKPPSYLKLKPAGEPHNEAANAPATLVAYSSSEDSSEDETERDATKAGMHKGTFWDSPVLVVNWYCDLRMGASRKVNSQQPILSVPNMPRFPATITHQRPAAEMAAIPWLGAPCLSVSFHVFPWPFAARFLLVLPSADRGCSAMAWRCSASGNADLVRNLRKVWRGTEIVVRMWLPHVAVSECRSFLLMFFSEKLYLESQMR